MRLIKFDIVIMLPTEWGRYREELAKGPAFKISEGCLIDLPPFNPDKMLTICGNPIHVLAEDEWQEAKHAADTYRELGKKVGEVRWENTLSSCVIYDGKGYDHSWDDGVAIEDQHYGTGSGSHPADKSDHVWLHKARAIIESRIENDEPPQYFRLEPLPIRSV